HPQPVPSSRSWTPLSSGIPDSSEHTAVAACPTGWSTRIMLSTTDSAATSTRSVTIGVGGVSFDEIVAVARGGARVELDSAALDGVSATRRIIDDLAADPKPHYGISTGFGALATTYIDADRRAQLQQSLIRSHAAGSGAEVEREVVRALMLLRLSTLMTGRTGVRPTTAEAYAAMLNA